MVISTPPTVAVQLRTPMRMGNVEHPAGAVLRVRFELASALIWRRARLVESRDHLGRAFLAYLGKQL